MSTNTASLPSLPSSRSDCTADDGRPGRLLTVAITSTHDVVYLSAASKRPLPDRPGSVGCCCCSDSRVFLSCHTVAAAAAAAAAVARPRLRARRGGQELAVRLTDARLRG